MAKQERLDKILSNMGYGSRKDIKNIIKKGRVKINGEIIKNNAAKLDPYTSIIELDGQKVKYREYIYLMMNKPDDVVSSTDDPINKTVIDLIDKDYRVFNPFPVGRLDKDTEGLLILSNDGQLAHELLSPKKHVDKTYYVEVEGCVNKEHIDIFQEGIILEDGYKTKEADLEILVSDTLSKVYLTIREGKFHQVKRMFQALEMQVVYLKRVSMGKLKLDDKLKAGDYRELEQHEIKLLMEN